VYDVNEGWFVPGYKTLARPPLFLWWKAEEKNIKEIAVRVGRAKLFFWFSELMKDSRGLQRYAALPDVFLESVQSLLTILEVA